MSLCYSASRFYGTLPAEWATFYPGMVLIYLDVNPGVAGTLPQQWSHMHKLQRLELTSTQLQVGSMYAPCVWMYGSVALFSAVDPHAQAAGSAWSSPAHSCRWDANVCVLHSHVYFPCALCSFPAL